MIQITWKEAPGARTRIRLAGRNGAIKGMQKVLQLAKEKVPVDTGRLRDSGHLEETRDGAEAVFDAPYALYVHEMDLHHERGERKYLENALMEQAGSGEMLRAVEDSIREELT